MSEELSYYCTICGYRHYRYKKEDIGKWELTKIFPLHLKYKGVEPPCTPYEGDPTIDDGDI